MGRGETLEQAFQVLITKKYSLLKPCVVYYYLCLHPTVEVQQIPCQKVFSVYCFISGTFVEE